MEGVEVAADEIARGVAAERVPAEQQDVDEHDQRAEPDAETPVEVEGKEHVPPEDREHRDREIEGVAVQVL